MSFPFKEKVTISKKTTEMLHCKNIFKQISNFTYFFLEVSKMRVNIGLSKGKREKYENT